MLWYFKISFIADKLTWLSFCCIYTSKYYQSNFTEQSSNVWREKFGIIQLFSRAGCICH